MNLLTFKTLWGYPDTDSEESLEAACGMAVDAGFDGIEGQIPADGCLRDSLAASLEETGLHYIAEICTAGSYVPDRSASLDFHLTDLELQLSRLKPLNPMLINCLGGCDRWDVQTSCEFFRRALEIADRYAVKISFETHRGRSLYSPWTTAQILDLVALPVTCDFSHWCVVCEGLGDTEDELIHTVAGHARHIHGRIGYDQGPQVPDPRNIRYRNDLKRHLRWWCWVWEFQSKRGEPLSTLTPEFGPDGYQMINPASNKPFGDLNDFNQWMAECCRAEFTQFVTGSEADSALA